MNKRSLLFSGFVVGCMTLVLLTAGCSMESVSAGGGTEGGNTVCGVFINDDNSASKNAKVYLLPSDFNAGIDNLQSAALSTTTDEDGSYTFAHTESGVYSIQAEDTESGKRTLVTGVNVTGTDVDVPVDTLRESGTVRIALPETPVTTTGYLYVPGTTIFAAVTDTSRYVTVKDVPAKCLPSICLARQSDTTSDVLRYDVQVNPNDTTVVANTQWKYSRRIFLNTSATGAGVDENVTGFPVVIRLTGNEFDFSQAHSDGGDLRFFRTDSIPLAHEIERWDQVAGFAEVWVGVDTIYGSNSTQFITMYWSNSDASDSFTDLSVFDTALGFQGVWHLGGTDDTVYDATPNRFHGLRNGTIAASSGMVGNGLQFTGSGAFIDMGNVLNTENNDLTISAWVKRSATGLQTIMAKSEGDSPNVGYGWTLSFHTEDQLHFFTASGGTSWGTDGAFDCWSKEEAPVVDTTAWYFVAAVFDRSNERVGRLYIDGVEMTGGSNGNITGVTALTNEVPFRIGAESDGDYNWTGLIDECVVSHTVRSESWIRLCYTNQGPEDLLIQFE